MILQNNDFVSDPTHNPCPSLSENFKGSGFRVTLAVRLRTTESKEQNVEITDDR
jgi:hypothetical protein